MNKFENPSDKKEPQHPLKEKALLGATEDSIKGVPEFEDLITGLESFVTAVDEIKNFQLSPQWLKWKEYEKEGNSPQRKEAKEAVQAKLDTIEKQLDMGSESSKKMLAFYKEEIERA